MRLPLTAHQRRVFCIPFSRNCSCRERNAERFRYQQHLKCPGRDDEPVQEPRFRAQRPQTFDNAGLTTTMYRAIAGRVYSAPGYGHLHIR